MILQRVSINLYVFLQVVYHILQILRLSPIRKLPVTINVSAIEFHSFLAKPKVLLEHSEEET